MMDSNGISRIVFYPKGDMACGYNLQKAEELLKSLEFKKNLEINDLLELYNIKQYFDFEIFLLELLQS